MAEFTRLCSQGSMTVPALYHRACTGRDQPISSSVEASGWLTPVADSRYHEYEDEDNEKSMVQSLHESMA